MSGSLGYDTTPRMASHDLTPKEWDMVMQFRAMHFLDGMKNRLAVVSYWGCRVIVYYGVQSPPIS
jgi:hypothetical protein